MAGHLPSRNSIIHKMPVIRFLNSFSPKHRDQLCDLWSFGQSPFEWRLEKRKRYGEWSWHARQSVPSLQLKLLETLTIQNKIYTTISIHRDTPLYEKNPFLNTNFRLIALAHIDEKRRRYFTFTMTPSIHHTQYTANYGTL